MRFYDNLNLICNCIIAACASAWFTTIAWIIYAYVILPTL